MNQHLRYKLLRESFEGENFHKFRSLRAMTDLAFYESFLYENAHFLLICKFSPLNVSHYTYDLSYLRYIIGSGTN